MYWCDSEASEYKPPVMLNLIDYPRLKLIELMIIIVKIIMNNIVKIMVIK